MRENYLVKGYRKKIGEKFRGGLSDVISQGKRSVDKSQQNATINKNGNHRAQTRRREISHRAGGGAEETEGARRAGGIALFAAASSASFLAKQKTPAMPVFFRVARRAARRQPGGGEGEIRTLEPLLTVTRFPVVRARPGYATSPARKYSRSAAPCQEGARFFREISLA